MVDHPVASTTNPCAERGAVYDCIYIQSLEAIPLDIQCKLAILADPAKYDASCASSGTTPRDSLGGRDIGLTEGAGICHSYAPDGRCISLLKVLFTNYCLYDCLYCINRVTSNVPRARFTVDEVVQLTLDFYRRNCIEGLFLSSGIIRSADHTMEQVVEVARVLREEHDFRGYIHLKTIPEASPELLARAGLYADRLSINIELPTHEGLLALAPEKDGQAIRRSMARLRIHIEDANAAAKPAPVSSQPGLAPRRAQPARFAPAGQSTQMIVGADSADDRSILLPTHRRRPARAERRWESCICTVNIDFHRDSTTECAHEGDPRGDRDHPRTAGAAPRAQTHAAACA